MNTQKTRTHRLESLPPEAANPTLAPSSHPQKIIVPDNNGFVVIESKQIVWLEADNSYTWLYLLNGEKMLVCRSLKAFEIILTAFNFARIHRSYIINLGYLKKFSSVDGGVVRLLDGSSFPVSKRRLGGLHQKVLKMNQWVRI